MTTISYSIDWVTATLKDFTMVQPHVEHLQESLGEREWLIAERVPPPYTEGFESDAGVICWSPDYPEFGVMFRSSGSTLAAFRRSGGDDVQLIRDLLGQKWGFTRVDIALDIYDGGGRPKELYDLWRKGRLSTVARNVTIYQSAGQSGGVNGETVYIGSRKTAERRLVRVYDKAAEQDRQGDWIRVELELTQKYAQKAAQMLIETSKSRTLANFLHSIVPAGLPDWVTRAVDCEFEIVQIEADRETNFERWFTKIVLPAIEKAVYLGMDDVEGMVNRAMLSGRARRKGNEMSPRAHRAS